MTLAQFVGSLTADVVFFGAHTSRAEIAGFLTGIVSVFLAVRVNVWNWPIGILNNLLYVVVFYQGRLFADMSLQVVYIVISGWGIYQWMRGVNGRAAVPIRRAPVRELIALALIVAIATAVNAAYLARINDAAPVLDALTAIASLGAQYLLARKYLENWYLWIAIDIASVGLYVTKGLGLTAVLYAIFLVMCIVGAVSWQRTMQKSALAA